MKKFLPLLLMLIGTPALAQVQAERDFETFIRWFSGSWDNEIQVFNEAFNDVPDEDRHNRIHMAYQPIRAEAFPGVLFVIKNYGQEGVRGPLNYMSVHHFFPVVDRNAIAHEFFFHKDGDWAYLEDDPTAVASLTPDDIRVNTECTMYWQRQAGQFVGATDPGACRVGEDRNLLDAKGMLSRTDLWRRDLVLSPDGDILQGHEEFEVFRKVRYYNCSGRRKTEDGGWQMFDGVRVHNQGDFVWLGGDILGIQLRQITWTTGFFENATALQIYQNGAQRPTVNGHGSLTTRYIGIDHPEFVVNCER